MTPATPKPAKDNVYVDAEDDITAIIDKVEQAKNKVVAVVLPKRTPALQSIVNMRLLKRSAKNADKNVVLITSEQALLPLAGAAEMHVAKSLQSKPEIPLPPMKASAATGAEGTEAIEEGKLDSSRPIGELALAHEGKDPDAIDLDDEDGGDEKPAKDKPAKDKKLKIPNFDRFRLMVFGGIGALLLLIFFLIFGFFVWPKATIAIQTSSTPLSANFSLDANAAAKALDEVGGIIPAVLKTSDLTGSTSVPATGTQNNGTKATGSVAMSAGTCGPNFPPNVPAGTGVSANGLTYITQATATFSAQNSGGHCVFQSNSVGIVAQQGGTKYNTSLNSATVSGYPGVTASGSASGGTDNNITVVSQSDIDGAKQKIAAGQNTNDFTAKFEKQLTDQGLYVITATLKAGDPQVTASPAVGQQGSASNVAVKVTYSILAVQKSDFAKAITDELNKQIDTKKQKINSSDVTKDANVSVLSSGAPTEAKLQISESTTAIPTIDIAGIQKQAGGLKKGDIKDFISSYPGVKSVDVSMSPFWVSKAPKKPSKVHVIIKPVKNP